VILVDTSILVAWLDKTHPQHQACTRVLMDAAGEEELAVSSVTYAELAAGGRTREAVDADLDGFRQIDLSFDAAWRAGVAFRRYRPGKRESKSVLPDFLIRGQAAVLGIKHLTNDRRRTQSFPDVDFLYPES
jgi:predicted nucleic acid-binding protein